MEREKKTEAQYVRTQYQKMDIGCMEKNYHEITLVMFVAVFTMTDGGVLNVVTTLRENLYGSIVLIAGQDMDEVGI